MLPFRSHQAPLDESSVGVHPRQIGTQGYLAHKNTPSEYRDTSLIRKRTPLGTYSRLLPRVLGGGSFLMSEVPLYGRTHESFWTVTCDDGDIFGVFPVQGYLAHEKTPTPPGPPQDPPRTLGVGLR